MVIEAIELPETSLIEAVDKLFLRFLVGKNKIYKEEEYNDGLFGTEFDNKSAELASIPPEDDTLINVKKRRLIREEADKTLNDKRNAVLTRHFQKSLLKLIQAKLEDSDTVILDQLRLRESTIELLRTLLSGEPRYSVLASLLEDNLSTKKHLLTLVGSEEFMNELDRIPREVRDIHSAVGLLGTDILRYLIPAVLFKHQIDSDKPHNVLFAKKLCRYELTLGQTCSALMKAENYRRPYEGMLLSAMLNLGYVASYQQYLSSFGVVRNAYLEQAREKGEVLRHDFFYELDVEPASLQALLAAQSNLQLSLALSEKLFSKSFPHLLNALKEHVESMPFESRSQLGKILFKALRFAKYDLLHASRLFKPEWLGKYLKESKIEGKTYKSLHQQGLFRFKPTW